MKQQDEVGGVRIASKTGVAYRLNDIFHASLIASANNATEAVARSTGLSRAEFIDRMNQKAKSLGAEHTVFYEPTGMSPANVTTSTDYAKIVAAAFNSKTIRNIAVKPTYTLASTNNKRYRHTIKNTDKLLGDDQLTIIGGKTGFLDESRYNFAAELKDVFGNHIIIVLLGSQSSAAQFRETRELAALAGLTKSFGGTPAQVLGSSSPVSLNQ